ncbi:MAG: hypothetical protein FWD54_02130 [Endomicrobia bacterium]|nr:hypothetical protein [Endomicrobiia bacterium]MCL2799066.1 hypothetical protein [Endomicrobiia bacterium]
MKRHFSIAVCLVFIMSVFIPSFLHAEDYMVYEDGVVVMVEDKNSEDETASVNKNDDENDVSEETTTVTDEHKDSEDDNTASVNENENENASEEPTTVTDERKNSEDNKTAAVNKNNDENVSEETKTVADERKDSEDNKTASVNENEDEDENSFVYIGNERKTRANASKFNESGNDNVSVNENKERGVKAQTAKPKPQQAKPQQAQNTGPKPNQDEQAIAKKVQEYYNEFMKNPKVVSFIKFLSKRWEEIKAFVSELPGIKQYNNSIYTNENYKKEMGAFSTEYKPHIQSNSEGVQKAKEGAKKL